MPELPEVETIRAQLAPRLEGRVLERVEILDPRLTRPNDLFEVAEELEGDRVAAVERRGKYLVVRLESGLALLVHLRMTGGFGWEPASHERAVIELDDGTRVVYRDVRRFGTWLVLEDVDVEPYLTAKNGPVVGIASVREGDEIMVITQQGMVTRTGVDAIRIVGRNTQGVKVMTPNEGDKIATLAKLAAEAKETQD